MTTTALLETEIKVRDLDNPEVFNTWRISQNLTDRWGEINDSDAANKPLAELLGTPGLLDRLRDQMVDECTFIVRKDGRFGILFEIEYASQESETEAGVRDVSNYLLHADLLRTLIDDVKNLRKNFPAVDWVVPDEDQIYNNRLAIWGFFPDGALTKEQRTDVVTAIYNLDVRQVL
jgi:hypothetical protein